MGHSLRVFYGPQTALRNQAVADPITGTRPLGEVSGGDMSKDTRNPLRSKGGRSGGGFVLQREPLAR